MIFSKLTNEYKTMTLGLERIETFLNKSKVNYRQIKYIHIAGTNGKGSVAKMLSEVCIASGYKTGLYISPHLIKINERIQIDSLQITDAELKKLDKKYLGLARRCSLTFFEYITALALIYFTNNKVAVAVLETGLGGRFDATNIVKPLISIITTVNFDHTEVLGRTLQKIAFEKAGIIKEGIPVICGKLPKSALSAVNKEAKLRKAKIYRLNKDFNVKSLGYNWNTLTQKIDYKGLQTNIKIDLNLLGKAQVYNIGIVLCACEILRQKQMNIRFDKVSNVFESIKWEARFDVRKCKIDGKRVTIIIDGAHNLQAVRNFLDLYGKTPFAKKNAGLVFAMMEEKNYKAIIKRIAAEFSTINLVKVKNTRALGFEALKEEFLKYIGSKNIFSYNCAGDCLKNVKNDEVLVCLGSFYLAGDVIKFIEDNNA